MIRVLVLEDTLHPIVIKLDGYRIKLTADSADELADKLCEAIKENDIRTWNNTVEYAKSKE